VTYQLSETLLQLLKEENEPGAQMAMMDTVHSSSTVYEDVGDRAQYV
jgi:hypothetical protein